ncbi:MAG: CoA pyrophosphatase [Zoogloeaceae bacterium]|jgi:8-oxo-dGTP pyrophosphatase MutT (NUDIX family)|nr:CoA pyrophosphatase [Zoogloeaceae bacterium]
MTNADFIDRLRLVLARMDANSITGDWADLADGRVAENKVEHEHKNAPTAANEKRAAAVLVPLVLREDGTTVLLTRRTAHLHHHAGQISFPGGGVEAGDASAEATALRETREEIGLAPERVELLGRLPRYVTGTGFCVTPVVGLLRPPLDVGTLAIDAFEVAEVFEVPLAFLLNPANHQRHSLAVDGQIRHFHAMPYGDCFIWGATAGMLMSLYRALEETPPAHRL